MKRGSNIHNGVMIPYWISKTVYNKLTRIKVKTGRCLIDIFNVAIRHRFVYSSVYKEPTSEPRPLRKKLRVSRATALELSELAWDAGLSRSRYLADTITLFLRFIDQSVLCDILVRGKDIRDRMLE
jgi:hypothetical protein